MLEAGPSGVTDDDNALIQGISRGDAVALTQFYQRHRNTVYRFAWAMSRSKPIAEDATQDTFLNAIENAHRFNPVHGEAVAWLLGCARHKVVDRLRALPIEAPSLDLMASDDVTEARHELERRTLRLHAAITTLPLPFREVVVLCDLQEIQYTDAAIILDCPIGTIRSRLSRARQMLRKVLNPENTPHHTERQVHLGTTEITST